MALSASSNNSPGRTPGTSVHDRTSPDGTATTVSIRSAAGPGTIVRQTSRSTASPSVNASSTSFDGSCRRMRANRAASVMRPVARTALTAASISPAVSTSSGCVIASL